MHAVQKRLRGKKSMLNGFTCEKGVFSKHLKRKRWLLD